MKTRFAALALAAALVAPVLAAAQPATPQGQRPDPRAAMQARVCADFDAHLAARLAWIEAKVKPTDAQRAAWDAFQRDSRAAAARMQARCAQPEAAPAPGDLAAELARREQRMAAMLDTTRRMRAAVEALQPVLSEEQRKALAENFHGPRGMHAMHHRGHGEHREHREHRGRYMQHGPDGHGTRQGG